MPLKDSSPPKVALVPDSPKSAITIASSRPPSSKSLIEFEKTEEDPQIVKTFFNFDLIMVKFNFIFFSD